jgi:hypothetical protein
MQPAEPDRLEEVPADVLDVGARRPRERRLPPRTRRVLVGVLAAGCLAGGTAWLVDDRARAGEERALADCHDRALRADLRASTLLANMVAYVAPALYVVPAERRAGLVGPVARAAADGLPGVDAALERCASTHVGRLHGDLADRRSAYVDYLEARVRRLEEVAADATSYYREQPGLEELRARAFGD